MPAIRLAQLTEDDINYDDIDDDDDVCLQVSDVVSCLALQRPADVVVKLVDSAVQSRGHVDCVAKLLHRLPTLTKISTDDGRSVLLVQLHQHIATGSAQNIAGFCRLLLVSASAYINIGLVFFEV